MLGDRRAHAALVGALDGVDRLVLLGDVLELRQGPLRDALWASREVLTELGVELGPGAEVVLVPGNHDNHLLAPWFARRSRMGPPPPIGLDATVDWRPAEALALIARWVAPAQVRAAYPGVWLRNDVYATHGHYLDRHTTVPMFERLAAGAMARIVAESDGGPRSVRDYEVIFGPVYAWIHAVAQNGGPHLGESSHGASAQAWRALAGSTRSRGIARRALIAAFPLGIRALNRTGLGPLNANLSGHELRRAALRAFGEVLVRLEVEAEYVVFGHTHRAGPLPGDDVSEWRAPTGSQLINAGCWVHEPYFLGPDPGSSPYRPGFSVLLEDDGPPSVRCLLD